MTTILKTNQYSGLDSFTNVGPFVPLTMDRHGTVLREVAPAQFLLARPDRDDEPLRLTVALIRDLRRTVACSPSEEELPRTWWADIRHEEVAWWQAGWQPTPAPAAPTEPKLIPIVTTAPCADALELARAYIHRWPAQENVIRDWLIPLGIDTNHGFAKVAVENSEGTKRRTHLEQRLARLRQWAQSAGKREAQASQRRERLRKTFTGRSKELYQELWAYQRTDGASKGWPIMCCGNRSRSAKPSRMPS